LRTSTAKLGFTALLLAACGGDTPDERDTSSVADTGPDDAVVTTDVSPTDVPSDDTEETTRFDTVEDPSEDPGEDAGVDSDADTTTCESDTLICDGGNIVCPDDGAIVEQCDTASWGGCIEGGCVDACVLAETVDSDLGCEFFGVDLPTSNSVETTTGFWVTNPGPSAATVTVEDNTGSIIGRASVPSRGSRTIQLPAPSVAVPDGGSRLSQSAYLLTSDSPVSVVQEAASNGDFDETTDASLLFPVHTLGGRTAVVSWPHSVATPAGSGLNPLRSSITLVGAGDSQSTLRVTTNTASGVGVLSASEGEELVFQLARFEVLHLENEVLGGDLSGTVISSTGPVAVFSSVRSARVPAPAYLCESGAAADPITALCCADGSLPSIEATCADGEQPTPAIPTGGASSSDHLQAQMPPEALLGQRFIMGANALSGEGRWRVAAPNPTQIQGSNGSGAAVLEEALRFGDVADYDSSSSWTLAGTTTLVAAVLLGSNDTLRSADVTGDAAIALVPPVSAFRDNYTAHVPSRGSARSVLFMVQAGHSVFGITGCADPAPAGSVDGQAFQTITCPIAPGTHYLRSDAPFGGVLCWGNDGFGSCSPIGWGANLPQAAHDLDNDGETDGRDVCIATAGGDSDSDSDQIPDSCDADKDGDGCLDRFERAHASSDSDPTSRIADIWISADGDDSGFGTEDAPLASVAAAAIAACDGTRIHLVGDDVINGSAVFEDVEVVFAGPGPALEMSEHELIVRNGSVTFDAVDIDGCTGGAVVVGSGGHFIGDDVHVSGCASGFAVAPGGRLTLSTSEFVGASGDSISLRGGATLTDVAVNGGSGVLIQENTDPVVADGLTVDGAAGAEVCGVRVISAESPVTLANLRVGNTEGSVGAGLLIASNQAPVLVRDSFVSGNRGSEWSGIALVDGGAPIELRGIDAIDNQSSTNAGIYASGGTESVGLNDVRAIRNNASRNSAGIIANDQPGALLIEHAVVIANSAGSDAGVMITDTPDLLLGNVLVVGNLANGAVGVSLIRTSSSADVHNLTVSDNFSALFAPSGLFCEAQDGRAPTVRDTIVGFNTVAGVNYPVTGCAAAYTMSDPTVPDVTNLTGDPLFASGPNGAYYLAQGIEAASIAVDRGSRTALEAGLSERTTFLEEERDSATVDLGYHHPIGPIRPDFVDSDGDGIEDSLDNCPDVANVAQSDACDE
jgi:hypothetical protein